MVGLAGRRRDGVIKSPLSTMKNDVAPVHSLANFYEFENENQPAVNSDHAAVRIEARWKQMLITR